MIHCKCNMIKDTVSSPPNSHLIKLHIMCAYGRRASAIYLIHKWLLLPEGACQARQVSTWLGQKWVSKTSISHFNFIFCTLGIIFNANMYERPVGFWMKRWEFLYFYNLTHICKHAFLWSITICYDSHFYYFLERKG